MRIEKFTIKNFRSFSDEETVLDLKNLSVLIGANSSGKTAAIQALSKLFSPFYKERIIEKSDFHIPNDCLSDLKELSLSIEAKIGFPELEGENPNNDNAIPPHFHQMSIDDVDGKPYVRMRLEASFTEGFTPEGNIDQGLYYVLSPEGTAPENERKEAVKASERSQIQMIYIPATRNPSTQLKNASGTILGRILKGINWPKTMDDDIAVEMEQVNQVFDTVKGVRQLRTILNEQWGKYHNDFRYSTTSVTFNHANLDSILKKVEVYFEPTEIGSKYTVDQLGDGLRSVFYLSLVNSLLEIENQTLNDNEEDKAYNITPPALTILAVEEPENHISPHLLGRIMNGMLDISCRDNSQVVVATHSPSMVKRVDPESILHFRIEATNISTIVNPITLPDQNKEDEYKYIKAAVKAYPELYFSQLVVLGEGDSEEIIIPKLIELLDTTLDQSNTSVVPLGGRHVNHFWRLLDSLKIPYITLLDLDMERNGGGWGRIKYVLKQMLELDYPKDEILMTTNGVLSDEGLEDMHNRLIDRPENRENLWRWMERLERYRVFFSSPLDIDFVMIEEFLEDYKKTIPLNGGPRHINEAKSSDEYQNRLKKGIHATLKSEGGNGDTYTEPQRELMIWYDYFFLGKGKPSTHIMALENIEMSQLDKKLPSSLKKLMVGIKSQIKG